MRANHVHTLPISCTASIGIGLFPEDGLATNELMARVDAAMYEAKAGGRNLIKFVGDVVADVQQQETVHEAKVHHIPLGRGLAVMLVICAGMVCRLRDKTSGRHAVAAPEMTRAEKVRTALKAMSFVEEPDGWHLSPLAPLVFEFDSDTVASHARDNLLRIARELRELGHRPHAGAWTHR